MTSDVVVIGGGMIGGTIAWRLAQAGAAVELLEAGAWGAEASWAGAGMLAPGGEVVRAGTGAKLALEGRAAYADYVGELSAISGRAIDFRECGALELAAGESEKAALLARMEVQREWGIASEWLEPERLRAMAPQLSGEEGASGKEGASGAVRATGVEWAGAAWYPGDAVVNPRELMAALRVACEASGVRVREGVAVGELVCEGTRVEARAASGGVYGAESAVLAAGAWSSHVKLAGAGPLVESFPVRGHLMHFQMPPGWLGPIVRRGHTYLFQRGNGTFLAGATTEKVGFDRTIDEARVREIREGAAAVFPALAACEPVEIWNGLRPNAAQSDPVVGRVGESRLWAAYGHYRNGILMAPSTAAVVAGEITSSWGRA